MAAIAIIEWSKLDGKLSWIQLILAYVLPKIHKWYSIDIV